LVKRKFMRRGIASCTAFALAASLALVLVSPASAQQPPFGANNFNPQDSTLLISGEVQPDRLVLSDKFDGADYPETTDVNEAETAHITSVAGSGANLAIYVICPPDYPLIGVPPSQTIAPTTFPPAGCVEIGRDITPSPVTPGPGAPFVGDIAFEFHWDIPSSFDGIRRTFLGYHCTFGPTGNEPGTKCIVEAEPNVLLDDSNTSFNSSSGELFTYCVDRNSDGDCADAGDSAQRPLRHGTIIPSAPFEVGQLLVTARVSADVNQAKLCVDLLADAFNKPNACDIDVDDTTQAAQAYAVAVFPVALALFPTQGEFAFILIEDDTGADENDNAGGFCDTGHAVPPGTPAPVGGVECVLDVHYVVSSPPFALGIGIHNDEIAEDPTLDATHNDDPPTFCKPGASGNTTVVAGELEQTFGCVFDQFGELLGNVSATMSLVGSNAKFVDCEGTIVQTDDPATDEKTCHFVPNDSDNHVADNKFEAEWSATVTGPVTVTFCVDVPNLQTCAGAGLVISITKNIVPGPAHHVHLRLQSDARASATCHPGTASFSAQTGKHIALQGCLFDAFHNGINDQRVIWRLNTTGFPGFAVDDPAHFVNVPEQTTHVDTGHDGRANGVVTAGPAAAGHLTNVFFCLDSNLNGECDDFQGNTLEALFQISWTGAGCIRGTAGSDTLRGTKGADCIRGLGGNDHIFGGFGKDIIYGGFGDDVIHGGPGKDTIIGGPGFDICWGRGGFDTFVGCEKIKHGA
jgi:RTX calcium-binding nonapeptide repeat (4 copies)